MKTYTSNNLKQNKTFCNDKNEFGCIAQASSVIWLLSIWNVTNVFKNWIYNFCRQNLDSHLAKYYYGTLDYYHTRVVTLHVWSRNKVWIFGNFHSILLVNWSPQAYILYSSIKQPGPFIYVDGEKEERKEEERDWTRLADLHTNATT